MKNCLTTRVPNGVLFVYDPDNDIVIPDDTGAGPITVTESCLAVWTIGEDDGCVSISLVDDRAGSLLPRVFRCTLNTPNKKIAVLNSQCDVLLEIAVLTTRAAIEVRASDQIYPDVVEFVVSTPKSLA